MTHLGFGSSSSAYSYFCKWSLLPQTTLGWKPSLLPPLAETEAVTATRLVLQRRKCKYLLMHVFPYLTTHLLCKYLLYTFLEALDLLAGILVEAHRDVNVQSFHMNNLLILGSFLSIY